MTYLSKPNFVRNAAHIASVLFFIFIVVQLLVAAGIIPISVLWGGRQPDLTPSLRAASVVTGYMALNTLGNFASVSNVERFVFGPMTLIMMITSLIVAVSRIGLGR